MGIAEVGGPSGCAAKSSLGQCAHVVIVGVGHQGSVGLRNRLDAAPNRIQGIQGLFAEFVFHLHSGVAYGVGIIRSQTFTQILNHFLGDKTGSISRVGGGNTVLGGTNNILIDVEFLLADLRIVYCSYKNDIWIVVAFIMCILLTRLLF